MDALQVLQMSGAGGYGLHALGFCFRRAPTRAGLAHCMSSIFRNQARRGRRLDIYSENQNILSRKFPKFSIAFVLKSRIIME